MNKYIATLLLCLFAGTAAADLRLEVGPTVLSGELSFGQTVIIGERVGQWDFGLGWINNQVVLPGWESDHGLPPVLLQKNLFIHAVRFVDIKRVEIGFGVAYFAHTSRAIGQLLLITTTLRLNLTDRLSVGWRHYSSGGASKPNLGQDLVTVGVQFN